MSEQPITLFVDGNPILMGKAELQPIDYKAEAIELAMQLGWVDCPEAAPGLLFAHAKEANVNPTGTIEEPHEDDWWWLHGILLQESQHRAEEQDDDKPITTIMDWCRICRGYTTRKADGSCGVCEASAISGYLLVEYGASVQEEEDPFADMAEEPEEEADQLLQDFPAQSETFGIYDRESADWLLKKLAAIASERDLIKAQCKLRLAQLEADETRLNNRFRAELDAFVKEEVAKGKRKSLTLLHGTVTVRKVSDSYKVEDERAAMIECEGDDQTRFFIKTKSSLDSQRYLEYAKQHMELTGELLPGIVRTEAHEAVSIRFPKKGTASAESESEE